MTGSSEGIEPEGPIVKVFPFRRTVWLCISPPVGVKWYSSRVVPGTCLACFFRYDTVPLNLGLAWTVVLLSRFINKRVMPCCKRGIVNCYILFFFHLKKGKREKGSLFHTYGLLCTMRIGTDLLGPQEVCRQHKATH